CIHQQDVPVLENRSRPEENLAPRIPALLHVADILTDEMTYHWDVETPDKVSGKNEAAIQRDNNVQPAPSIGARNIPAQCRYPTADSRGGVCRGPSVHEFSSAIKTPTRVLSLAANSAATGKPRAHARTPPLVNTGQPSRSQRATRCLFNKRFNL